MWWRLNGHVICAFTWEALSCRCDHRGAGQTCVPDLLLNFREYGSQDGQALLVSKMIQCAKQAFQRFYINVWLLPISEKLIQQLDHEEMCFKVPAFFVKHTHLELSTLNLWLHCLPVGACVQTGQLDPCIHRESLVSLAASRFCCAILWACLSS